MVQFSRPTRDKCLNCDHDSVRCTDRGYVSKGGDVFHVERFYCTWCDASYSFLYELVAVEMQRSAFDETTQDNKESDNG